MTADQVFEYAFALVFGLGFGVFICRVVFGVDLLNWVRKDD